MQNKKKTIEIIFHGGLGNQLFQVFYTLCLLEKYKPDQVNLNRNHLASYKPPREFELDHLDFSSLFQVKTSKIASKLSRLRIPKILNFFIQKESPLKILNLIIVDGYFQKKLAYKDLKKEILLDSLNKLQASYSDSLINTIYSNEKLHHFRLGDGAFLMDSEKEYAFFDKYFKDNNVKFCMTDKEVTLKKYLKKNLITDCTIVNTDNMDANEIISLMGAFKHIKTNGSTLALWGALLFGKDLKSEDNISQDFFNLFKG